MCNCTETTLCTPCILAHPFLEELANQDSYEGETCVVCAIPTTNENLCEGCQVLSDRCQILELN